jgi:electron transfer flavoprotein beta subunit
VLTTRTTTTTNDLSVAVIVKLEPDFSEGNVSYNADGTLNRAETKSILGPHSAIASNAAFSVPVHPGARPLS